MIEVKEIIKSYNKKEVLNVPELQINQGEVIGVVGNNGAGKSTLFKLMLDLIASDQGYITINNIGVTQSEEWKNITGAYLDNNFLLDFLSKSTASV